MNEVKRTTLSKRLRGAWNALRGKPVGYINYGVSVHHCDKCERGNCNDCYLATRDAPKPWIDTSGGVKCPACGYICADEYYLCEGNFCPVCGQHLVGLKEILEG